MCGLVARVVFFVEIFSFSSVGLELPGPTFRLPQIALGMQFAVQNFDGHPTRK